MALNYLLPSPPSPRPQWGSEPRLPRHSVGKGPHRDILWALLVSQQTASGRTHLAPHLPEAPVPGDEAPSFVMMGKTRGRAVHPVARLAAVWTEDTIDVSTPASAGRSSQHPGVMVTPFHLQESPLVESWPQGPSGTRRACRASRRPLPPSGCYSHTALLALSPPSRPSAQGVGAAPPVSAASTPFFLPLASCALHLPPAPPGRRWEH